MIKIFDSNRIPLSEILKREDTVSGVEDIVADIIYDVRKNKDAALFKYAEKFDKVTLSSLEVTKEEIEEALKSVEPKFIEILREAAENIALYHKKQLREGFEIKKDNGIVLGQKVLPVERAGLYVPGGTAAYPSTVLMDAIPAKIAGVKELVIATPPSKDGRVNPVILAAASIAGVDRIFKMGGAQAIAAMAYGTESVPKVDKIVGPGNVFVAEAKRQVYGTVSIDMIAGPSEILVVADGSCNPVFVAADLLSQAEHDKNASAVLITDSITLANAVQQELERQAALLPREEIARTSIDNNGKIIIVENIEKAIEMSNMIAPEHLEICVDEPFKYLDLVKHAGSVFLGKYCPEALGDYFSGTNHTLPTSGTARFSSPLSVDDFIKKSAYSYYTREALSEVAEKVAFFAEKEGLSAHARSATVRIKGDISRE